MLDLSADDDVAYAVIRDTSTATQRIFIAGAAGPDAFVAGLFTNGQPDPAFGTNGVLRMSLGGPSRFTGMAIGDTAASLILSGVVTRAGGDDAVLARITKDGRLDSTFGTAGVVVADLGGPADRVAGTTVGWSSKTNYVRYFDLAGGDGKDGLVVTFDGSGRRVGTKRLGFGAPTDDWVHGSHRFADGKTLVHGVRSFAGPFLARMLADGSPDPSFGRAGLLDPALGANVVPRALAIAGDGGIIALFDVFTDRHAYFVARFLPDGRRDLSFGPQGVASLGTAEAETYGVVPLPDGRVMVSVGGRTFPLSATCQRDMSWGGGLGVVSMSVLLPEPDGNLLAFRGDANGMAGTCLGIRAERYRPDGTHAIAWCAGPSFDPTTVLRRPDGRMRVPIDRVTSIAAGAVHSVALRADGVVWSWGWNAVGQLGIGSTTDSLWPYPHTNTDRLVKIAAGAFHTLGLSSAGHVYAWGWNVFGQLGLGEPGDATIPTVVPGIGNAVDIAGGGHHSLAVTTNVPGGVDGGTVWAWGWNGVGQLGDGTTTTRFAPVPVPGLAGIRDVAAGVFHSLALGPGGALWTWGWNAGGQQGDGTLTDRHSPWRATTMVDGTTISGGVLHTMMG